MNIIYVRGGANSAGPLLDQMFRLRARVFRDRLGWNVTVHEGYEVDQFDALEPNYLLAITDGGVVCGCARLLPTTGPTMLQEVFPHLLKDGILPPSSKTIESSRFCVDTEMHQGGASFVHEATLSLFSAIIEWSMSRGFDEIVTATDLRFERLLRHVQWPFTRLGDTHLIGNVKSVAGSLPANQHYLDLLRPENYCLGDQASAYAGPIHKPNGYDAESNIKSPEINQ